MFCYRRSNGGNGSNGSSGSKAILTIALLVLITLVSLNSVSIYAVPVGPSVVTVTNETAPIRGSTIVNTTGGSITTMILNVTAQNLKWKAFVGNVTGTLVLQDADGWSIYDWFVATSLTGEVYATRSSDTIAWSSINCATAINIANEEKAINHTSNPDDNISATFDTKSHSSFYVGVVEILQNSCYSINTNVNNQSQSTVFEETLLYDGTDMVYATKLEQDETGYDSSPYDFQMIVPEIGLASWDSSTAYYFYAELT